MVTREMAAARAAQKGEAVFMGGPNKSGHDGGGEGRGRSPCFPPGPAVGRPVGKLRHAAARLLRMTELEGCSP